jgi:3'-phosphoadenosine 5'-phosphosulfate sulfotransferase (PAPS reductase)/FAD synthetase
LNREKSVRNKLKVNTLHPETLKMTNQPQLTVLSFSAGQDSMAILVKLIHDADFRKQYAPHDFIVVMADTGNEHKHTYKYLKLVEVLCKRHNIPFYLLKPNEENVNAAWLGGLVAHFKRYSVIISKAMRAKACTDQLKIAPIYKFLSRYVNDNYLMGMFRPQQKQSLKAFVSRFGKLRVMIGFTAEEAKRRIGKKPEKQWMAMCVEKVYPLVDLGMNRKDCQDLIKSFGYPVPYPSNCMFCPFASKREILWLYRYEPLAFQDWVEMEKAKIRKFAKQQEAAGKKNHGVSGQNKTLEDVLREAITEFGHLTDEELNTHKFSHGHCVTTSH